MSNNKPLDECSTWAINIAKKLGIQTDNLVCLNIEAYAGSPLKITVIYWSRTDDVSVDAMPDTPDLTIEYIDE